MRQLATIIFAVFALAGPVAAVEETTVWGAGEVAGWYIAIDNTIGGGCYIYTTFEGDSSARIGFDPGAQGFYLLVGDLDWQSMEDGGQYDVVVQMGSRPEWTATAAGARLGDIPALVITFDDAQFIAEFAGQRYIILTMQGQEIANLSLKGSSRAIDEMIRCQEAVNAGYGSQPSGDPFAKPTPQAEPVADPFRPSGPAAAPGTAPRAGMNR